MQRPDFSGEWTLNREASALSPVVAPVVQSGFVKIEHREPTVSVHLSIQMDGKPFDARFQRSSEWDGEALASCSVRAIDSTLLYRPLNVGSEHVVHAPPGVERCQNDVRRDRHATEDIVAYGVRDC
jgi:hypothetical protein